MGDVEGDDSPQVWVGCTCAALPQALMASGHRSVISDACHVLLVCCKQPPHPGALEPQGQCPVTEQPATPPLLGGRWTHDKHVAQPAD